MMKKIQKHNHLKRELCLLALKSVITVRDNDVMINDIEIDLTREEFRQTLAVKGSVAGRAPVVCDYQTMLVLK